jgi:hypothetical protein
MRKWFCATFFSPQNSFSGATYPRSENRGLDFDLLSEIILCATSPSEMILDLRSRELTIYDISDPIHIEPLPAYPFPAIFIPFL